VQIDNKWQAIQDNPLTIRDLSDDECRELVAIVVMLNKMVDNRNAVIDLIPECPAHGVGCLVNAAEWIQARIASEA
jgi:hypothetical protein